MNNYRLIYVRLLINRTIGWGYRRIDGRWPTVEAMMLDLDGDGLLDRVENASTETAPGDGQCKASWRRNLGPAAGTGNLQFGPVVQTFTLPRLKWRGTDNPPAGAATAARSFEEGCALNGQFTSFQNSIMRAFCHNGTSCAAGSDPNNPGPFCYPEGTECPPGAGGAGNADLTFPTYLAYRWLDMDADGLVDLVAVVHGDIDHYDIVQGNGFNPLPGVPGPLEPDLFAPWPACPSQMDRWGARNPHGGAVQAPYTRCEGLYPWFIYKNTGNGTFASSPVIKYQPVPLESDFGDSSSLGPLIASQFHGVLDFDGDGVLDAIVRSPTSGFQWLVWLGDGDGGFASRRYTFLT
jgi:hypothetical protein